jgi:flagellar basal-body rod modification protein FlgD
MTNALLGALSSEVAEPKGKKKSEAAQANLTTDFNNFLKMLTTQLKYQDPSAPLESKDFIQQIVAFTGVEQAVATNKHLEKLVEQNESNHLTKMAGLVGKEITYNTSVAEIKMGDRAEFSYQLEPFNGQEVKQAVIQVINEQNLIIKEIVTRNVKAGKNNIVWDGLDAGGKKAASGMYRIQVSAVDADNQPVIARDNILTGKVNEAEVINGKINLTVGENIINMAQVKSLKDKSENKKEVQE